MQSDKLNKNAPAHPTNVQQPAAAIPHNEVSLKQSDVQKQIPAPTQVKQGNTVTLTQAGSLSRVVWTTATPLGILHRRALSL